MTSRIFKSAAMGCVLLLAACTTPLNMHGSAVQLNQELSGSGAHLMEHSNDIRIILLVDNTFIKSTSRLTPQGLRVLGQVALLMHQHTSLHIRIEGYTDNRGKEKTNQLITLRRAMAVADYFRNQGIDSARIDMSGMGSANPIASNDSAQGRQANRRVELTLFNK